MNSILTLLTCSPHVAAAAETPGDATDEATATAPTGVAPPVLPATGATSAAKVATASATKASLSCLSMLLPGKVFPWLICVCCATVSLSWAVLSGVAFSSSPLVQGSAGVHSVGVDAGVVGSDLVLVGRGRSLFRALLFCCRADRLSVGVTGLTLGDGGVWTGSAVDKQERIIVVHILFVFHCILQKKYNCCSCVWSTTQTLGKLKCMRVVEELAPFTSNSAPLQLSAYLYSCPDVCLSLLLFLNFKPSDGGLHRSSCLWGTGMYCGDGPGPGL